VGRRGRGDLRGRLPRARPRRGRQPLLPDVPHPRDAADPVGARPAARRAHAAAVRDPRSARHGDARTQFLAGCGHFVPEERPAEVAAAVRAVCG
jgi:pimeloyl-ACP methyl ester carboxylesterase